MNIGSGRMDELPLFVFGTLRGGQCNHHLLAGRYERMLPARLCGYEKLAPLMIAPRAGGVVRGELYFFRSNEYATALRRCDRLEGIPAGRTAGPEYRRIRVTVETAEGAFAAWAYVHPDSSTAEREM